MNTKFILDPDYRLIHESSYDGQSSHTYSCWNSEEVLDACVTRCDDGSQTIRIVSHENMDVLRELTAEMIEEIARVDREFAVYLLNHYTKVIDAHGMKWEDDMLEVIDAVAD